RLEDDTRSRIEPASVFRPGGRGAAGLKEPLLRAFFWERVGPGARTTSLKAKPELTAPRRGPRGEPSGSPHRLDKVEHGERPQGPQAVKLDQVWPKRDYARGKARALQRGGDSLGGNDRVELIGAVFGRRVDDRNEAPAASHQALFRRRSSPGRARPYRERPASRMSPISATKSTPFCAARIGRSACQGLRPARGLASRKYGSPDAFERKSMRAASRHSSAR